MIRLVPHADGQPASRDDADRETRFRALGTQLREKRLVIDSVFDDVYPLDVRAVSSSFWTPVSVALRAAELLVTGKKDRILDIGSGVGKFCIVGAASTRVSFVGIEQRARFVLVAEDARRQVGARTARFIKGNFDTVDITDFDGVYFFNPFEENLWGADTRLDDSVELSDERYHSDIETAKALLERARIGTRVVTYHGFGGDMPDCYELALSEKQHTDKLDLWIKRDGDYARPPGDS